SKWSPGDPPGPVERSAPGLKFHGFRTPVYRFAHHQQVVDDVVHNARWDEIEQIQRGTGKESKQHRTQGQRDVDIRQIANAACYARNRTNDEPDAPDTNTDDQRVIAQWSNAAADRDPLTSLKGRPPSRCCAAP